MLSRRPPPTGEATCWVASGSAPAPRVMAWASGDLSQGTHPPGRSRHPRPAGGRRTRAEDVIFTAAASGRVGFRRLDLRGAGQPPWEPPISKSFVVTLTPLMT